MIRLAQWLFYLPRLALWLCALCLIIPISIVLAGIKLARGKQPRVQAFIRRLVKDTIFIASNRWES